jgi:predicted dehydrogenase
VRRIKVGIVGAGTRAAGVYLPLLRAMSDSFTPCGIVSRSRASAASLGREDGISGFGSIEELCSSNRPDLLVVAVSAAANGAVALEALTSGCAVLLETPLALHVSDSRNIVEAAQKCKQPVGVAEQKPFLPWECFKQRVTESGALGRVMVVDNDFRSHDYHAMAQLRRYLQDAARPLRAQAVGTTFDLDPLRSTADAAGAGPREDRWEIGTIEFDDGSMLMHRYSTAYKKTPFRTFRSLRVYGTAGTIVNEDIAVVNDHGLAVSLDVTVDRRPGLAPLQLSARVPTGPSVTWINPFALYPFSDDQVAVASHLMAMRGSLEGTGRPLYAPAQALLDLELVAALRRSIALGGRPVSINTETVGDLLQSLEARSRRALTRLFGNC